MTTIIGTGEVGALHSREELEEMQRLPLQRKIQITTARIIEWYQHYDGKVYVAFSGGKDSIQYYSILCGGSTPMCLLFSLIPGLSSRKSENLLRAVKTLRLSGLR